LFPIITPVMLNMPDLVQAGSQTRLPWPDGSVITARLVPTDAPGTALLMLGSYRLLAQVPPATPMGEVWLMLVNRQMPARFALLTVRKDRGDAPWAHVAASCVVADSSYLSSRSSCRTRVFPVADAQGRANLDLAAAATFLADVAGPEVESLLAYALAVLSAPAYRALAGGQLALEFPRIPSPPDEAHYRAVVAAGRALVEAFAHPGEALGEDAIEVGHCVLSPAPLALVRAYALAQGAVSRLLEAMPILEPVPALE